MDAMGNYFATTKDLLEYNGERYIYISKNNADKYRHYFGPPNPLE